MNVDICGMLSDSMPGSVRKSLPGPTGRTESGIFPADIGFPIKSYQKTGKNDSCVKEKNEHTRMKKMISELPIQFIFKHQCSKKMPDGNGKGCPGR